MDEIKVEGLYLVMLPIKEYRCGKSALEIENIDLNAQDK